MERDKRQESLLDSNAAPPGRPVCILSPVHPDYAWLVPFLEELLGKYWPSHPEIRYCTHPPEGNLKRPPTWCEITREGVRAARKAGFELAYLIAEEHAPLGPCHETHLNRTLPNLLAEWDAAYIALMGWDNRRIPTKTRPMDAAHYRMIHLTGERDGRFGLHPALWRLDTLQDCLDATLAAGPAEATAWRFEKVCGKPTAPIPDRWKNGCYQIYGRALRVNPPSPIESTLGSAERFVFLKLMALCPPGGHPMRQRFWETVGFDNFYYEGPYPMFFSGLMAKGQINRWLVQWLKAHPESNPNLLDRLTSAFAEARK